MTQGNADLACSILLEGINPAELAAMAQGHGGGGQYADYGDEDPGSGMPSMPGGGMPPGMAGAGAGAGNPMASLLGSPQFAQIAQRMREDPQVY